jgi:hypothetical protein
MKSIRALESVRKNERQKERKKVKKIEKERKKEDLKVEGIQREEVSVFGANDAGVLFDIELHCDWTRLGITHTHEDFTLNRLNKQIERRGERCI